MQLIASNHTFVEKKQLEKILIVINPKAGKGRIKDSRSLIAGMLEKHFEVEFLDWESPDSDITGAVRQNIAHYRYSCVVAAGGDGTVNRTAKALTGKNIPMGIIPLGSGNGLARHLNIPMNLENAAKYIIIGKTRQIDTCTINDEPFFCTAGAGFDAHVGKLFSQSEKRGFSSYLKIVAGEFKSYKPQKYRIKIDEKFYELCAFLITVANAGQYGNNAYIAPLADISDGLMDVTVLKPFGIIHAPALAGRLFLKKIHKSSKIISFKATAVEIVREEEGCVHFDGEPAVMGKELNFKIHPLSLKIIVP